MTTAHGAATLGTGLIANFYTATLHGQRGRERVHGQDRACGALWRYAQSRTSMPITRPLRQRMRGIVVADVDVSRPTLHLNRGLVVAGAVLIGVGGVLGATGILLGTYAVVNASRDWMSQLEVPPTEIARRKLHQARKASVAAADAWRQQSRESTSA